MTYVRDHLSEHLPGVRSYARKFMGNRHDADDAVSMVCVRALAAEHTLEKENPVSLRAWLITIARRECVDLCNNAHGDLVDAGDFRKSMEPTQELCVQIAELEAILRRLCPERRRALIDYELSSGGYRQIAAAHGVPVGTIRSRISLGREHLRQMRDG